MNESNEEKLHNLPKVKAFRKTLRKSLTPAEATLWKILKGANFQGRKFRRQHSVGRYVLDFYCPAERLAVELDGEVHFNELAQTHDRARKRFLNEHRIRIRLVEAKLKKLPSWTGGVAAASADGVVDYRERQTR